MAYVRDFYAKPGISVPEGYNIYSATSSFYSNLSSDILFPALALDGTYGIEKLVFTQKKYDKNSDYDTSTGNFTAPYDGLYTFSTAVTFVPRWGPMGMFINFEVSSITGAQTFGNITMNNFSIPKYQTPFPSLTLSLERDYVLSENDTVSVYYRVLYGQALANDAYIDGDNFIGKTFFAGSFIRGV